MQQKAIIVNCKTLFLLQELLDDGWTVVHTCPMPSSNCEEGRPTCLVVVQKIPII